MAKHRDMLQFQAERHPLEGTNRFETLEQYCLYLIHLKAYEEVRTLAGGKVVLDLGCNNGWGTHVLGQVARRVVGVDVSRSALEEARRSATSANVEFRRVDGEELPFADGEFDIVASCQVIEHVADYGPYLGEIIRVLSPDGIAVFSTPNARIRLDPGMKPWFPFHVREFSGAELGELLRQWFPGVQVRGLFATKELYKVEYDRVQRSRERARRLANALLPPYVEIKAKIIGSAKLILPNRMVRGVQGLVRRMTSRSVVVAARERLPQQAVVPQWVSRFSTANLYYTEENVDEALDLLAVCGRTAKK
jgi:2-polyprenyl-3-methyl-5-hydroxy-6-metoxy-1,4-benzoquinol methylase